MIRWVIKKDGTKVLQQSIHIQDRTENGVFIQGRTIWEDVSTVYEKEDLFE